MLITKIEYEIDLKKYGMVNQEQEVINIDHKCLAEALEKRLSYRVVSMILPLDSPTTLVVETDDPLADRDLLGHMYGFAVQLMPAEEEWICSF